jgi:hypothetical protein
MTRDEGVSLPRVNSRSRSIPSAVRRASTCSRAAGTKSLECNLGGSMARGAALANARIIGRKREEQQVAINIYLQLTRAAYSARCRKKQ